MTIDCTILSSSLPMYKGAAKEMGVAFMPESPQGEYIKVHIIVSDYSELLVLGFLAGMNSAFNSIKNPLAEITNELESKIDKVKKNKDVDDL